MKHTDKRIWTVMLAAVIGILILLSGYSDQVPVLRIRQAVLNWAGLLIAVLLFFAIIDFILGRIRGLGDKSGGFTNSFVTFAVFFAVLIYGLSNSFENNRFQEIVLGIQGSIESGLVGLICIAMIGGLYRLSKFRSGRLKTFFILSMILFLILYSGVLFFLPENAIMTAIVEFVETLPLGGIYGLLLGIAIGSLVTGIRILFLGEHPYSERKK